MLACHRVLLAFYAVFLFGYHQRSGIFSDHFLCLSLLR
ncbi:hypothetical protein SynRS9915_01308 [Synechococcus sp. RS9915]|nr:hypothetical protein SynRS9915_01308 [Synechococcus sp. RS9915]